MGEPQQSNMFQSARKDYTLKGVGSPVISSL